MCSSDLTYLIPIPEKTSNTGPESPDNQRYKLVISPDPKQIPIPKVLSFDVIEEGKDDSKEVGKAGRR